MSWRSLKEQEAFVNATEEEIICNNKYCPWHTKHMSSPSHPCCEGEYCEEAWENFCGENDLEYES